MSDDAALAMVRELDRLLLVAKASNRPDDWETYFRARRIVDDVLRMPRPEELPAPAEGRAA